MTSISSDEGAPGAPSSPAAGHLDQGDQPGPPLRLSDGLELIGLFEGSGYKEAPYLARRADGQTLQLSRLLYLVAEAVDRHDSLAACAREVTEAYGRPVSEDNVAFLVEEKLRPLGVVVDAEGNSPATEKGDPMLALTYRAGLIGEDVVRRLSRPFQPLFNPAVMGVALVALLAVDVYVFGVIGIGDGLREALYQPSILLAMLALVVLSAAFHEFGHAAATAAGGASPGKMGAGLYLVWPVFYTDVTDAYRLPRWRRVIVDLGGVYFNALVVLATFAVYLATGWEPLLLLILIQHLEMLHQFLPFVRLDGYYVVSDVTGVPDLFPRIKPILISLLPWRDTPESVQELKPWVRVVVTGWVLLVVPVLVVNLALMAIYFPRILATTWDSALVQYDTMRTALPEGDIIGVAAGVVQVLILLLPVTGIPLIFYRLGRRVTSAVHSRIQDWDVPTPTPARAGMSLAAAAAVAFAVFVVWPNGDYAPLQEGERLNGPELVSTFRHVPSGRPGFAPSREAEIGEVTSERERRAQAAGDPTPAPTPSPSGTPTASPSPSPSPSPPGSPSPSPSPSPSVSPSPSPGQTTSSSTATSGTSTSGTSTSGTSSSLSGSGAAAGTTTEASPTPTASSTPSPAPTATPTPTTTTTPVPRQTSAP